MKASGILKEVASAVAFLASSTRPYITLRRTNVDGGMGPDLTPESVLHLVERLM